MSAEHTTGPWLVETPMDGCFSIVDAADEVYDWKMIAQVTWDDKEDRDEGHPYITKDEAFANARLISSAPDLLTALRTLMDCSRAIVGASTQDEDAQEAFDMYFAAQERARVALAKAKQP